MKPAKKKFILAVDIGGTKIATGIVDSRGKILYNHIEKTNQTINSRQFLKYLKRIIDSTIRASVVSKSQLIGISISAPGPLDVKQGKIIFAPNLPKLKNFQIVKPLKKTFKLPVILENDANAAALAEWMFGSGRGTKNLIYLTVSTGIGSGIIINGRIYRGQGNAGELGHMIINLDGSRCSCGNFGCLEALASGTAIIKKAKKAPKNSLIWRLAQKLPFNASLVFLAAENGDKFAQKIIKNSLMSLSIGLINIIHIFHPDKIILGGGVMTNKKIILPFIKNFVRRKVMPGFRKNIKIEVTKLGSNIGLIGAGAVAIDYLKKQKNII